MEEPRSVPAKSQPQGPKHVSEPGWDLPFLPGHQLKAATGVSRGATNRRATQLAPRNNNHRCFKSQGSQAAYYTTTPQSGRR